MLIEQAWRNLWRQPRRTALSVLTIAFAAAAAVFISSLQQGGYSEVEENALRLIDGFAQVQPPGYSNDSDLRIAISNPSAVMARLNALPGVTASAPRANSYAILSYGPRSYGSAIFGVDPAKELRVSSLGRAIVAGRYLAPGDTDKVVVGAGLARNLKLTVGGKLTMLGSARGGSVAADLLTVVGIFSTGVPELDHQVIEIPLARFQSDFAIGDRASLIAVTGPSLGAIEASLPGLHAIAAPAGLVIRDWTELEPALHDAILIDAGVSRLCYVSLLVIIVFIILNTLLMSVLERTREFGMLTAIGMRPNQIGRMVWLELLFLTAIGVTLGIAIGVCVTLWDGVHGIHINGAEALFAQWHMAAAAYPRLTFAHAVTGPFEIALVIVLSGIVPYIRVRRLQPVFAMRAA